MHVLKFQIIWKHIKLTQFTPFSISLLHTPLKKIFLMFIFETEKERDRESMSKRGQREIGRTQNLKWAPGSDLSAHSLTWGSDSGTARS